MANFVLRPCASCGNSVETRRLTSTPTCSPKCYMRLRRQAEKDKSTLVFSIGKVVIKIHDLPDDTDRDALYRKILNGLPPELIKGMHLIEIPETN